MFKRTFFWLLIFIAVGGSVMAIRQVIEIRKTIEPAKPVAPPARSPFQNGIGARGLIESVDENVRIAPAVAGLVTDVKVKVNNEVAAGDVLVQQDSRDVDALLTAQEAEIVASKAQLAEAEVALADKKDMWARMEKLSATRVASEEEKQRTLFAVRSAEALLSSMRARIASAEANLNRVKVQRTLLVTTAPRAGTVLQVNTRKGEFVSPADKEPMLLLGSTKELQLRADIDEVNASRYRENMSAIALIKGQDTPRIPLKFVRVEPYILPKRSLTGDSSERVDTRVLQVIYRFDRPAGVSLFVGQQMDVFIDAPAENEKPDGPK